MQTWLSWSSGKDSAWSLEMLRRGGAHEVTGLFTTVNAQFDRVAMHAVRRTLLEAQAKAAGLPLHVIDIPYPCPKAHYERIMGAFVAKAQAHGVAAMAFGDLFLADIRAYREWQLAGTGIAPLFPLWEAGYAQAGHRDDRWRAGGAPDLRRPAQAGSGIRGTQVRSWVPADLPAGIDPCGENGEFHTFVSAGPMFRAPIPVRCGDVVERDGFVFADMVPAEPVPV